MALDLVQISLFSLVLGSFLILSGFPLASGLEEEIESTKMTKYRLLATSSVIGFSVFIICFWVGIATFDNLLIGILSSFLVVLLSWAYFLFKSKQLAREKVRVKFFFAGIGKGVLSKTILSLIVSIVFTSALLSDGTFSLKQRTGPDALGWMSSANYFKNHSNAAELERNLESLINPLSIDNVLDEKAYNHGESPIFRIAGYSTQVNSEFIIGAKRFAGPATMGLMMRVLDIDPLTFYPYIIFFLIFWSSLILFLLTRAKKTGLFVSLIICAVLLNPNTVVITLEGGLGNLLSLPAVLFLSHLILESRDPTETANGLRKRYGLLVIVGVSSLMLYFDSLVAIPLLGIFLLISHPKDILTIVREGAIKRPYFWLITILILWFGFNSYDLLVKRTGNRDAGGWSMGDWPTLSDSLGLLNWYPLTGAIGNPELRTTWYLFDVVLILAVIAYLKRSHKVYEWYKSALAYSVLIAIVGNLILLLNNQDFKTYQIAKLSYYFSIFFFVAIKVEMESRATYSKKISGKKDDSIPIALYVAPLFAILAGIFSLNDFSSNSQALPRDLVKFSIDSNNSEIWNNYDLIPVGFMSTQLFLLLGDDIYYSKRIEDSLWGDVTVREKIYVVSRDYCSEPQCAKESRGLKRYKEGESFIIFKEAT